MKKGARSHSKVRTNDEKNEKGLFLTFKRGLKSFVDQLEFSLDEGTVKKGTKVQSILKENDSYKILLNSKDEIEAVAVTQPQAIRNRVGIVLPNPAQKCAHHVLTGAYACSYGCTD